MAGEFLTGLLENISTRSAEKRKASSEEDRMMKEAFMKSMLAGEIEPTGEAPVRPQGAGRGVAEALSQALGGGGQRPMNMGQLMKQGQGIEGMGYQRPSVTMPTAGPGEEISKKYGARGEFTGATVSPETVKEPFTQGKIQTTLGDLESGGKSDIFGMVIPFQSKQDAINHALQQLGPNWEQIAPQAREIIDRKFLEEEITEEPKRGRETSRMKVRDKASGQTGTIEASEFDPAKYDKI